MTLQRLAVTAKLTHTPGGMTVRLIAVILGTSFGPGERLPGSFEIGCGVTMLSGGGDALSWSQRYQANLEKLASGIWFRSLR